MLWMGRSPYYGFNGNISWGYRLVLTKLWTITIAMDRKKLTTFRGHVQQVVLDRTRGEFPEFCGVKLRFRHETCHEKRWWNLGGFSLISVVGSQNHICEYTGTIKNHVWMTSGRWLSHPSEKYERQWDDCIPKINGKIKNVPNHQPDNHVWMTCLGVSKI